ncbi:MAG: FtsX-like permease family protein [Nocardioides sp.]
MSWWTSWRLALRLARRDLGKNKARAIIALAMVTLPVLLVVAADVLIQTAQVSPAEGIDRRLGTSATAEIATADGRHQVQQGPDPMQASGTGEKLARPTTVADIEAVIGKRSMTPAPMRKDLLLATVHGREYATGTELDVKAPLAAGLFRLASGRWPASPDEVVVNRPTLDRIASHSTLTIVERDRSESTRTIVGTVVDATSRTAPVVLGVPGAFPDAPAYSSWNAAQQAWLIDGPSITWDQIQQLNRLGVFVTDRHVVTHAGDYPDPLGYSTGIDDTTVQVAALIVVMALIEVVLLAGPAFAVGARKQQRSLALLVSSGGTPAQARRVIIGGGLLLGVSAGVIGVVGGILAGRLLLPAAQRFNGEWLGPFEIDWLHVLAVAAFGLVSALIACVVPAWIASRQNVVAVLAGRRGDAKPVRAFPWLGLVLFAIGVLVALAGARPEGGGELTIAWAAVICVLGMVLLVPAVVSWMARMARSFPLPVRFAARDAVRHRTRTTPAVAAVAATVAGVVALGIAQASDEKQNRETYLPSMVLGNAAVTPSYDFIDSNEATTDWRKVADTVRQHVPGARISTVTGFAQNAADGGYTEMTFTAPDSNDWISPDQMRGGFATSALVSDGTDLSPTVEASLPAGDEVQTALAAGRAVVFAGSGAADLRQVQIKVRTTDPAGKTTARHRAIVPATVIDRGDEPAPAVAILPPSLATKIGVPVTTVGLELDRPGLSKEAEKDLGAALGALATPASLQVERGYQPDAYTKIVQWVLALLGGILMMGGTLTAMFLALTDARPDLATLAAVGAEARVRRKVAASYPFVMAFVGAVLGMLVGFVPGIAITRPLTRSYGEGPTAYFLEIPWLMIAVVVIGLPILASLLVGLCVRSKLPMVSRLS